MAGDSNEADDVFVHDRQTGMTTRVSIDSSGNQGNAGSYGPAFSADGRHVAFKSSATNLVVSDFNGADDVFVHDRLTGVTARVSVDSSGIQGDGLSDLPALSADGRYIAFYSRATNLVSGDTNSYDDVFVHDRLTGMTTRVSVDSSGNQGDGNSWDAAISADGRYVAFGSSTTNLDPGDTSTNGTLDMFVRGPLSFERRFISAIPMLLLLSKPKL
ncbi:MAG: TolB family protein [Desulfobulbaceae bacterium]